MSRRVLFSLVPSVLFLGVVAFMMAWPQLFTTADPVVTDVSIALLPPSPEHFFGTDQSGRDVFARVVYGARISVGIGLFATVVAFLAGALIGTAAGLAPRAIDSLILRGTDVLLAFPEFVLALVVVALLGSGPLNVAIAVMLAAMPVYVRLARMRTVSVRRKEFVESAILLGVPRIRIFVQHVVPHTFTPLVGLATIGIGTAILAAAGLSFLGLGPAEPSPEWGLMLAGGRNVLGQAWWIAVFPGLMITLTVISANVLGRRLRSTGTAVRA